MAPKLTPEEIQQKLTGRYVRLRQYMRGFWPRDTLHTLWKVAEEDGAVNEILTKIGDRDGIAHCEELLGANAALTAE